MHHHPINPASRNGLPILFMAVFCWLVFFTWAVVAEEEPVRVGLSDSSLPKAVSLWLESPETATDLWGPISTWNTEDVTHFDNLFRGATTFNEDLSQWNTDKVTSLQYTFADCRQFNQPLSNWNVEKVVSLKGTFNGASSFHQDLDTWNTSRVTDMSGVFKGATQFNGKLKGWNTSSVKSMELMFYGATFFQDSSASLKNWDVSAVTSMQSMFSGATAFNGPLGDWKPRSVINFMGMFAYTASFDQDGIGQWDVRSAQYMDRMFYKAVAFEQELCWDDSLSAFDVSGTELFCGSAGEFTMDCMNIPKGAEDYCPETYEEFEEDEELLDSLLSEPDAPFGQASDAATNTSSSSAGYGGSGGVGALNPGGVAVGRDHPHQTATLTEWERENPGEDRTEDNSGGATTGINVGSNNDEQDYFSGSSYPESVVVGVTRDDSAAYSIMARRMGSAAIISVATLLVTSIGLC